VPIDLISRQKAGKLLRRLEAVARPAKPEINSQLDAGSGTWLKVIFVGKYVGR
jgi:hypothetical protein